MNTGQVVKIRRRGKKPKMLSLTTIRTNFFAAEVETELYTIDVTLAAFCRRLRKRKK